MDRRIELVIKTMESRSDRVWDVAKLADLVNLSTSRLRHLFKQETGTTPVQFLRELRMRNAEILLRTTFLTIKEVGSSVGMRSVSHFAREFKKVHGISPTAYRIASRNNRKNSK
jgi:transcriptional regulator GlxA family with amidase domain